MKQNKTIRKVRHIMLIVLLMLIGCIVILYILLLAWSPGRPKPIIDESGKVLSGSISEKIFVKINGVDQGMFIRSKDVTNPVLLFVHGGPGMPEFFLTEKYPPILEEYFTVCWWEQRGAGLSYDSRIKPETITTEQLISDTLEVTSYLSERFGQNKIYLMGRSWGTFIGIQAAERAPELYHAYIGIAQISNQIESEKLAYEYMLEHYKAMNNSKMIRKLENYSVSESEAALNSYLKSFLRDEAMHDLGIGTMRNMKSVINGIFFPVMQCRAYALTEKINIWRGKSFLRNSTQLFHQLYSTDLTVKVPRLEIPVYFFSGIYDYTVSQKLSLEYYYMPQTPMKGFYTFKQSAHSPHFEESDKFIEIMKEDVLNGTTNLADAKEYN